MYYNKIKQILAIFLVLLTISSCSHTRQQDPKIISLLGMSGVSILVELGIPPSSCNLLTEHHVLRGSWFDYKEISISLYINEGQPYYKDSALFTLPSCNDVLKSKVSGILVDKTFYFLDKMGKVNTEIWNGI